MGSRQIVPAFLAGAVVGSLLGHRRAPTSGNAQPPRPGFPWLTTVLMVSSLLGAALVVPHEGILPLSERDDLVVVSIDGATRPEIAWEVEADNESHTLRAVKLVVRDWEADRTTMTVTFHGAIANAVRACTREKPGSLNDHMIREGFTIGAETPVSLDDVDSIADRRLLTRTRFTGLLEMNFFSCAVNPAYVLSSDGPTRHYRFPAIRLEQDAPLVEHDGGLPLFDIDSPLFSDSGVLVIAVGSGSFTVPAEAESQQFRWLIIGVLLGFAGGFLASVAAWVEKRVSWSRESRRAPRGISQGSSGGK